MLVEIKALTLIDVFNCFFADAYIGIIRGCFESGTVRGLNESDGCHLLDVGGAHDNHTIEICLCSQDYCNSAHFVGSCLPVIMCAYILYILLVRWCFTIVCVILEEFVQGIHSVWNFEEWKCVKQKCKFLWGAKKL